MHAMRFPAEVVRLTGVVLFALLAANAAGQAKSASASLTPQQALEAAEHGRCGEALPILRRSAVQITDKDTKYRAEMAGARCAMSLNQTSDAVYFLTQLDRSFPNDPQALYEATHYYSELANHAAQQLATTAPDSYQVAELNAEALESQRKPDDAIAAYRKILTEHPDTPELHFRIARLLLEKVPPAPDEAKQELDAELKIEPNNASAEFVLGEIARRNADWDTAIVHFARAAQFDAGFAEAFLALGMSRNSAGKHAEAIAPLERYVKMQPSDPAGHYQLATAYSRTGNKIAADREIALQRKLVESQPIHH